jgi:hypothetical protein
VLDCNETITGGKIPDTLCACYHFFFSSYCCQREDCVLPKGTSGQVCPASAGNICDYCDPQQLGQCAEAGAFCVVTQASETFCGKDCASTPCPTGYTCMSVQAKTGVVQQCVPSDMSCYY